MKKLIIIAALIILIPVVADAETVIKAGAMINYGKVGELHFTLPSAELKFEQSLYKGAGIGIGIRKETRWAYSGYYLSLYPMYKMKLSQSRFVAASLGVEYGLASSEYDRYITTYESGTLTVHKWIYLIQNAPIPADKLKEGAIGVIYPFATASYGTKIWKGIFLETGLKVHMLKFGVKSCEFDPISWIAHDIRNDKKLIVVPSIFIQIGCRLF